MRTLVLSAALAACLAAPAFAQTGGMPAYPPPGLAPPAGPPPGVPAYPALPPPSAAQNPPTNFNYQPPSADPLSGNASNIDQRDTRSQIAPALPSTGLGPDASPVDYLRAAEAALAAGQTGQTQEALAQAETRLLDRSVPYGMVNAPSRNPAVADISQALHALAAGDRAACMQYIRIAIPAAEASLR